MLKKLLLLGSLAWLGYGQSLPAGSVSRLYTVVQLPAASLTNGIPIWVTDGSTATSCSTGGGTFLVPCVSNGSAYVLKTLGSGSGSGCTVSGATGALQYNNGGTCGGLGLGTATTVYHGSFSGVGSFAAVNLATDVTGVLGVAAGGTGTATPVGVIAGANISVTGSFPNQTVSASSGGSPSFSTITPGSNTNSGIFSFGSGTTLSFVGTGIFDLPSQSTPNLAAGGIVYNSTISALSFGQGLSTYGNINWTGGGGSFPTPTAGDFTCYVGSSSVAQLQDCGIASSPFNGITAAQGNGVKVQRSTGSTTTNDCAKFDASGNIIDAGSACGSGGSSPLTTLGDIYAYSTTNSRFPVGSAPNGYILTRDNTQTFGFNWEAAPTGTLPSQTGNGGLGLVTNGTSAAWAPLQTGPSMALDCSGTFGPGVCDIVTALVALKSGSPNTWTNSQTFTGPFVIIPALQGNTSVVPTASVIGGGCVLGTPTGSTVWSNIPVTTGCSSAAITVTLALTGTARAFCTSLQDVTSGVIVTQDGTAYASAAVKFKPLVIATSDILQVGPCGGN